MRYRLWQRLKPYSSRRSPFTTEETINEDAHELLWEWTFWTLQEALDWGNHVQESLEGCFGEWYTYYQIYDTCLHSFYEKDGYHGSCAQELQERCGAL